MGVEHVQEGGGEDENHEPHNCREDPVHSFALCDIASAKHNLKPAVNNHNDGNPCGEGDDDRQERLQVLVERIEGVCAESDLRGAGERLEEINRALRLRDQRDEEESHDQY